MKDGSNWNCVLSCFRELFQGCVNQTQHLPRDTIRYYSTGRVLFSYVYDVVVGMASGVDGDVAP